MGAVAVLPDGRVVTGGVGGPVLVWDPAEPGAGPVELGRQDELGGGGGGAAGRAGGHRRRRLRGGGGCWCGTRRCRGSAARSSSAATRARWGRWRCCRTGGWSPAASAASGDGRVLVWDPAEPGAGPVELGRHDGRGGGGGGAAGRAGGHRRRLRRRAGAGVGPGGAGRRPGRARPPRGRGGGGGGAAGRAGGHRRHRDGRVLVWDPAEPGAGPVELGRHDGRGRGGGGAAGRAGGHRRRRRAGAGVGPGCGAARPGRARPRAAGWRRWRCCRTGGWSGAGGSSAGGCWCGTRRSRAPARSSSAAPSTG